MLSIVQRSSLMLYGGSLYCSMDVTCALQDAETTGASDVGVGCVQYGASQDAVPLLLTAQPDGVRLGKFLRDLATKHDSPPAELWAALRCLPHACHKPDQARTYK